MCERASKASIGPRPGARAASLALCLLIVVAAACDGGDDTVKPYPTASSAAGAGGVTGGRGGSAGEGSAGMGGGSGGSQAVVGGAGGAGAGGTAGASAGTGGAAAAAGATAVAGAAGTGGGGGASVGGAAGAAGGGAGFGGIFVGGGGGVGGGDSGASGTSGGAGSVGCPAGLGAGVDATTAVFVAMDAVPGGDGTMGKPLAKVQEGIALAVGKGGGTVIVAEGTYAETLNFGGLAPSPGTVPTVVRGGYLRSGSTWSDDCVVGNVAERTILAPSSGIPVTFTNVSNDSGVERLRVVAPKATAPVPDEAGVPGTSSVAIVVRGAGAKVRVVSSVVEASDAQPAIAPTKPKPALTGKCTGEAATCGTGASGAPAPDAPANTAVAETFLADGGFVPATGFVGTRGEEGTNGKAGGAGPSTNLPGGCAQAPFVPQPGLCTCSTQQKAVVGTPGRCGCGGNGGRPGIPGRGGGASAGIVVTGALAILRLEGSTVRAGKGGDGALGSDGGDGGEGSSGAIGASRDEPGLSCACSGVACAQVLQPCAGVCPTVPVTQVVPGGAAGGVGGKGGQGSKAGDGAGGPSCALVLLGGATLEKDTATSLIAGTPGKGAAAAAIGKAGGTCSF